MKNFEEKQLKKIERQIWWIETKIGWLRFVSGFSIITPIRFFPIMYFLIICPLCIVYFTIYHFYDLAKIAKIFVISVLFLLACYFAYALDKKVLSKIKSIEQKLGSLYTKRRNLNDIIN